MNILDAIFYISTGFTVSGAIIGFIMSSFGVDSFEVIECFLFSILCGIITIIIQNIERNYD